MVQASRGVSLQQPRQLCVLRASGCWGHGPASVTATHAIYKDMDGRKAPAAVVGVQIDYDQFDHLFMDVTTGPGGAGYEVGYS